MWRRSWPPCVAAGARPCGRDHTPRRQGGKAIPKGKRRRAVPEAAQAGTRERRPYRTPHGLPNSLANPTAPNAQSAATAHAMATPSGGTTLPSFVPRRGVRGRGNQRKMATQG